MPDKSEEVLSEDGQFAQMLKAGTTTLTIYIRGLSEAAQAARAGGLRALVETRHMPPGGDTC